MNLHSAYRLRKTSNALVTLVETEQDCNISPIITRLSAFMKGTVMTGFLKWAVLER